jgi:hypothetical protein
MLSTSAINELFLQKLAEDHDKTANEAGAYIRTKLREVSFARKILPPTYITAAELQRSIYHDQLVRVVDKEPDSSAVIINFRGQPSAEYVEGERFEIPFFNISSNIFQKAEEELLVYEMPIMEILERNTVKDIQYVEDSSFITAASGACHATGGKNGTISGATFATAYSGSIDPRAVVQLINLLQDTPSGIGTDTAAAHKPLLCDTILINQRDFEKLALWPATAAGNDIASTVLIDGYTYNKMLGRKLVTTTKGDLVPEGTMFAFAAPEFLGKFFLMGDIRFYIEKKRNIIEWSAMETLAIGFGNHKATAKLTITA